MRIRPSKSTVFLIALFSGSGVLHFLRPRPFVAIVPKMLPRKNELVAVSGVAELTGAILLAVPATRRFGGLWSAGLLAGVLPANVSMALRSGKRPLWFQVIAWARLPLQVPLIVWALRAGVQSSAT
jgi:uncharacterized membrane protein